MGWFKSEKRRSTLEQLASEAEQLVLAMPAEAQQAAIKGIGVLAEAVRQLQVLPAELVNVLWKLLATFIAFTKLPGVKPESLLEDIARGLPELDKRYGVAMAIRMLIKREEPK